MLTTLYAVETIDTEGSAFSATLQKHEIVVDIPDRFRPKLIENQIRVEYDDGTFSFDDLLIFRGGFPALALWDKDTYKEFDFPLPVVSDRVVRRAG